LVTSDGEGMPAANRSATLTSISVVRAGGSNARALAGIHIAAMMQMIERAMTFEYAARHTRTKAHCRREDGERFSWDRLSPLWRRDVSKLQPAIVDRTAAAFHRQSSIR
jgi:hypothetical protein